MTIVLSNVLSNSWTTTPEWVILEDFAGDLLNVILNVVYSIAIFTKDFVVDNILWIVFLIILWFLAGAIKRKFFSKVV